MGKIEARKGDKFGKLVIVEEVEPIKYKKYNERRVLCKCDCGNTKVVSLYNLIYGKLFSCGCYRKELAIEHGKRFLKYSKDDITQQLHCIWHGMKSRCNTTSAGSYARYGARGVRICQEWKKDFHAFYTWAISNGYSNGLTIDRIDSNGNYEPSNCRWVNYKEQANNRKTNIRLLYKGEFHTIAEWSDILGVSRQVLYNRKKKGWADEKILITPMQTIKRNN